MRWFACIAVCATLSSSGLLVTPAKADDAGIGIGSASSARPEPAVSHRHHHGFGQRYSAVSCYSAASSLWQEGYRSIEPTDCSGASYSFRARSNLVRYEIDVNAATGGVTFIRPY